MTESADHEMAKTMAIYKRGRVANELAELRAARGDAGLDVQSVYGATTMHYCGDLALLAFAKAAGLQPAGSTGPRKRILDLGSGHGGDSMRLASEYHAHVTALEVQESIHLEALHLTRELGFSDDSLSHVSADICLAPVPVEPELLYDACYSVLVILHIPDRSRVFGNLSSSLRPGAVVFIEDMFALRELTEQDRSDLAGPVACPYLPTEEQYRQDLASAGLELERWEDMTAAWTEFCASRAAAFRTASERHCRVHGQVLLDELLHFYDTVVGLFQRGNLGGVRLVARKKA